ncbi:MAG TPA: serine hydrolase [archaeon]|nr:serine hydrolase [archaeon]
MSRAQKGKLAIFLSTLFLSLLLYRPTALFAQAELASHGPRLAIDSLFADWDRTDVPGWAVGVIQDGRLVYQRGYGMASVEEGIPITSETQFAIASMSKQFTDACIVLLVIRGEISLDDDIRIYVPELPDYGSTVTIRHLIHHMSGIKDRAPIAASQWEQGERFGGSFDNQDALDIIFQEDSLDFETGTMFTYCGSNYVLLAEIVKRVSGQTLREFADENIFQPLGMSHTFFKDDTTLVGNFATEYHRSYVEPDYIYIPFEEEEFEYRYNYVECGPGGVVTTIEDLYLWDQNFYDNKLEGGSEFTDLMLSTGKFDNGEDVVIPWGPYAAGIMSTHLYGFGLMHTEYNGSKAIFHPGYVGGFQSIIMRFPEEELSIILMANYEIAATENFNIVMRIADLYLSGQGEEYSQGCDFNGDGKLGIADVVKLLLLARDNPDDPLVDWNSDGAYSWDDVVLLIHDIWNGHCPPVTSALLASAGNLEQVAGPEGLSAEDIAYLEQMMARMNLTPEQEAEFRLVLYGEAGAARLPKVFSLAQNSPNPFNPATTISYSVPEGNQEYVTLKVYDLRGRLVRTLVQDAREAGNYTVFWDGTDETGRRISSGVYLYRMKAGEFVQTRKMVILK